MGAPRLLANPELTIPPILLEGDATVLQQPSGPGERFALGPVPRVEPFRGAEQINELPEGYGTERLFLTARDPNWLYAYWDLTRAQRQKYNSLSADGHLVLRTYLNAVSSVPLLETHVHPESPSWFIHVDQAGASYVAELCYRDYTGSWNTIATSAPALTPSEAAPAEAPVEFAHIPLEVNLRQLSDAIHEARRERQEPAEATPGLLPLETPQLHATPPLSTPEPSSPSTTLSALAPFNAPRSGGQHAPALDALVPPPSGLVPAPESRDGVSEPSHEPSALAPPLATGRGADVQVAGETDAEPWTPSRRFPDQDHAIASLETSARPTATRGHATSEQPGFVLQQVWRDEAPLIEAVQQLRDAGHMSLPDLRPAAVPEWTPEQAQAVKEMTRGNGLARSAIGSLEIAELLRRHLQQEISSPSGPAPAGPEARAKLLPAAALAGVSSPSESVAGAGPANDFWFKVNAELVIYGSTDPEARVSMDGRQIRLRPDGTFSFRFALPDGQYPMVVSAVAADGTDGRTARFQFSRRTDYSGQIGAHPQDPKLRPPSPIDSV